MKAEMTTPRDSIVFYRSFYESIRRLPDRAQLALYRAISQYGLDRESPDFTGIPSQPFVEAIFDGIRPQLDANQKRFIAGNDGGCPPGTKKPSMVGNQNARKHPKQNQNETKTKPNVNVNVNENENENENVVEAGRPTPEKDLTLPFTDPDFVKTWTELRAQPKWRGKSVRALQMALKQLSKFNSAFSVMLMQNAIAGNYQGVVFDDTPGKYQRWLQTTPPAEQGEVQVVTNVADLYN